MQAEAEVFRKLRDTSHFDTRFGLEFERRDHRAGVNLYHRAGDVELFELYFYTGGGFVKFLLVVLRTGGWFTQNLSVFSVGVKDRQCRLPEIPWREGGRNRIPRTRDRQRPADSMTTSNQNPRRAHRPGE